VSHRGLAIGFPENTIFAFNNSIKNGFSWIELDVLTTKDNKIVCSHNFDLERKTDLIGYINKLNYNIISKGILNDTVPLSNKYKIPLLKDVLNTLPMNIGLNIEIKTAGIFDFSTARAILKLIGILNTRPYIISTFNPVIICYLKIFFRAAPIGFLFENKKYFGLINWIHPDFIIPRADMINNKMIKFAKQKNLKILTWTVNNAPALNWCFKKNLSGIMTDENIK